MYDVMTISKAKDAFLQIRIREDVKQNLAILAEIKGLSMSALINSLIVKAIREERDLSPHEFTSEQPVNTINRKGGTVIFKKEDELRKTGTK